MKSRTLAFVFLFAACLSLAGLLIGQNAAPINQTGTGLQLGTQTNQGIAFYGVAPVAQRSGSAQAAVTTTVGAAVATTASTTTTPYGYTTQAQADALVSRVNQLRADVLALTVLVNEQRAALVALGLIKGQ